MTWRGTPVRGGSSTARPGAGQPPRASAAAASAACTRAQGVPRRLCRASRTAARLAQQWNAITSSPEDWLSLKATLVEHCASVGRDPGEITCSVNVRVDSPDAIKQAADQAAAYRDAGIDLVIVNLPVPAEPAILEPLAGTLAPLA